ncbi:hypothetical protein C7293_25575 [filamentous cyanobacterium CCT1]|nr:hypothetical protein C7293_25575 [filamentous cyanobacterium CCT1]PSN78000.1 hypothetical protein C8B47_19115 [filamentous cyanobacterium CCP4]
MDRITLYLDEDAIDEDFVRALRSHNIDVLTVAEVGMLHRSDSEQLDWVKQNKRVLFSFNTKDFYQLHTQLVKQGLTHAGILLAPQQRYRVGELVRRVLALKAVKTAKDMQSNIEFLSKWNP